MNPSRNPDESSSRAATFNALGDPARLAIIEALRGGTTCVCELTPALGMPQNLLSYHLRILREAGLISGERSGRRIEYRIEPSAIHDLQRSVASLLPTLAEAPR
jgi:ArsR family transcriptional regulator